MGLIRGRGWVERLLARLPAPNPPGPIATILCYHSLDPAGGPHTSATPDEFGRHLDWLSARSEVVPLGAVVDRLAAPSDGRPIVAVTFDDGYEDNHAHALPALVDRGLTATFFVTSGFVDDFGGTRARMAGVWSDPAPSLRPMTWSQVDEMVHAGMEIGGHTRTHRNLAALTPVEARQEIGDDRRRIEDKLGRAVTSFAYPFGRPGHDVTVATTETATLLGYQRAVTVSFRRVERSTAALAMPRIPIRHDSTALLAAKLDGRLDLLGRLQDGRPLAASQGHVA